MQFYESQGKETTAQIVLPFKPLKVYKTNFLEEEKEEIKFEGNKIVLKVKPNSTVTLKIYR